MRIETRKRAIRFEEKITEKLSNNILKECFNKIEKNRENKNMWEADREIYFRKNRMSGIEVKRLREKGIEMVHKLFKRDVEIQKQIQHNRDLKFQI